ncbi:MAG: hypothetical protein KDB07_00690, partial [Planctomycetes bacterium]|nr:hypothetical protein [Planctomycetota bacterium]
MRDVDAVHRSGHVRIFDQRDLHRFAERTRQVAIHRRTRARLMRVETDDASEIGARRIQARFGGEEL